MLDNIQKFQLTAGKEHPANVSTCLDVLGSSKETQA